jgi:hypothetical protein
MAGRWNAIKGVIKAAAKIGAKEEKELEKEVPTLGAQIKHVLKWSGIAGTFTAFTSALSTGIEGAIKGPEVYANSYANMCAAPGEARATVERLQKAPFSGLDWSGQGSWWSTATNAVQNALLYGPANTVVGLGIGSGQNHFVAEINKLNREQEQQYKADPNQTIPLEKFCELDRKTRGRNKISYEQYETDLNKLQDLYPKKESAASPQSNTPGAVGSALCTAGEVRQFNHCVPKL